jgi:2-keto-4-pentenoate hydratase
MAASVGQVVSGGGAVFIGDVNAGRDINISMESTSDRHVQR